MQRLSLDDVEDHFIAVCGVNEDLPDIGDPAPAVALDPFASAERFARTFADQHTRKPCFDYIGDMRREMQSSGGISDAD